MFISIKSGHLTVNKLPFLEISTIGTVTNIMLKKYCVL